jgi:hypothetical protein
MSSDTDSITCRITPWYTKRMLLWIALLSIFAAWFFYDFKYTYPEKVAIYQEYEKLSSLPEAERKEKWAKISREKKWPETPDAKTQRDVNGQLMFAGITGVMAAGFLITFLFNRGKTLRADTEAFYSTDGKRIPFASVYKIDQRKWKHKGLATAYYKLPDGTSGSAVLDDLKYDGTQKILDRLHAQFTGELIDLAENAPAPAAPASENNDTPPTPPSA